MAKNIFLSILLSLLLIDHAIASDLSSQQQDRLYHLTEELRCLVCQNQSLADSNAPLALDLRNRIATLIQTGASDEEIKAYLKHRYGDFILYKPLLQINTLLLWCTPIVLLFIGLLAFTITVKRYKAKG